MLNEGYSYHQFDDAEDMVDWLNSLEDGQNNFFYQVDGVWATPKGVFLLVHASSAQTPLIGLFLICYNTHMTEDKGDATNPDRVPRRNDGDGDKLAEQLETAVRKVKFDKKCLTCKIVRKDKRIRQRIHNSRAFIPHSPDSISAIAKDLRSQGYNVSYTSLLGHTKKHDPPLNSSMGKELAKEILKKKLVLEKKSITAEEHEQPVNLWGNVIKSVNIDLESESIKPTLENALKAAKDYTDYMNKQKDQNMQAAKMIWSFASQTDPESLSGELEGYKLELNGEQITETAGDTTETPGDTGEGETRPDSVHNGTTGDAATRWPSDLYQGSTQKKS